MSVNSTENWLEGFEIKIFSSKHEVLSEFSKLTSSSISCSCLIKFFFQIISETFLCSLWKRSRYMEGSLDMYLWVSKKIVTIRHTNQIICQEKWKKFRLWKMKVKVSLENSDKISCFELRLFFKCHWKIFCRLYEHIQCIWEVRSTLIFASVKKSWLYDMSIGLYCEFSYLSFLRQHRSDFAKIDSMVDSAFERV